MRILIEEIVADVDDGAQEVVLVMHWLGGRHSELRVAKGKVGEHSRCTKPEAVEIVRQMSGRYTVSLRQPCVTRGPAYFGEESVARDPADRGSGQLRPASDLGFADAGAIEVEFADSRGVEHPLSEGDQVTCRSAELQRGQSEHARGAGPIRTARRPRADQSSLDSAPSSCRALR